MPSADDFKDYLARVKEAEEIGLTPAEVWRTEECLHPLACRTPDGWGCTKCGSTNVAEPLERCARCKRETAPENGYKTGAGFFCSPCSAEFDDGVK
jgi:hypothetical protein